MTKNIKISLLFLIVALFAGIWFITYTKQSDSAQTGYDLYEQGNSLAAFEKFKRTAESDPQSAYALAMMYMNGMATQVDPIAAERWLIHSANAGNKSALYNLGYYRYHKKIKDTADDENGLVSLTKAADLGVKSAQAMIGGIYIEDKNQKIPQDIELARKYFTLAAQQNAHFAKLGLAYIAYEFDKDANKAVELLTPLVGKDSPFAAILLGSIYEEGGNGISPNKKLAAKYKLMAFTETLEYSADNQTLEPVPLSIYGAQTEEEKQQRIVKLESRAHQGDENAIYFLFQKYFSGDDVRQDKYRAATYLQPLIEKKSPKALYLNYVALESDLQNLIDAADAKYPDAVFMLYEIYAAKIYSPDISTDYGLANKYLTIAADLGHHDALVTIIDNAFSDYNYPKTKLIDIVTKYTPILAEKYPDSPAALTMVSKIYGNKDNSLYSPEKSFVAIDKANRLSPSYESRLILASYYSNSFGTEQNLEKTVTLLKESIAEDAYPTVAEYQLAELYYQHDIGAYIDEETIIEILKKDINERKNYRLAHFYADYLMRQDSEKNKDLAFELYEKASGYNYNARIYYAAALLQYQQNEEQYAAKLVSEILDYPRAKATLTEKELDEAYAILLKTSMSSTKSKESLVKLAITDNNLKAQQQMEQHIGIDADITYYYGIKKLAQVPNIDTASDTEIKPYYDAILKASELGSAEATLYIAQNLDRVNYYNDKPYYKSRFRAISGLTQDDLIPQYKKCAEQGSNKCLYELGDIYQNGRYGEDANYDTALSYYKKITDDDFSFLKSRLSEIETAKSKFIEIQAKAKQNDADALYTLAQAYAFGNYGQKVDDNKWLKYLTLSAKFNNESALKDLIEHYSQDTLIDSNKAKILGYYEQLAILGNKSHSLELAHQYLNGSRLVEPDRQKAREYYIKAGSWGEHYINYMNEFDINLQVADESAAAKNSLGRAYYYGNGVKADINKAVEYLKAASEEGNDTAIAFYANMLYMGVYDKEKQQWTIEPNWDEAIVLLRKHSKQYQVEKYIEVYDSIVVPAQQGDTKAYLALADWYKSRNESQAAKIWYKKSIESGNIKAYRLLDSLMTEKDDRRQLYLAGIEKGDIYCKVQLARMSIYDNDIAVDSKQYKLAIQYLNEGMRSDDKLVSNEAFTLLARLYQSGIMGNNDKMLRHKDLPQYLSLIENESTHNTEALKHLYFYYAYTKEDFPKALGYLEQAYDKGDLEAIKYLYEFYYPGQYCSNDKREDIDKAASYLNEWLDKSHFEKTTDHVYINTPESLSKDMGDMYLNGDCDVDENIDEAIKWYKKSLQYHDKHALQGLYKAYSKKGDAKETYYYGLLLEKAPESIDLFDTLSESDKQALDERLAKEQAYQKYGRYADRIEDLRIKAEAGDAMAAFSLGISYARGEMVPEDTSKMIYYYDLAGKNGYSRAYNILGNLYRKDNERGIEKDAEKALYYFDLGAKQNDSNTAHLAGDMLYFGQGVERDYPKAAEYFEITDLEQGIHHAMAKYKLAYMYYYGLIGSKSKEDLQKAYDYLQLAAKYKNENALKVLNKWDFSQIKP